MKKTKRLASLLMAFALMFGLLGTYALADEGDDLQPTPRDDGEFQDIMPINAELTSAALYQEQADILFDLGLFKGTTTGYNLDWTTTRAQAATMLVRLLGLEAEVAAGTYEHPFTDVPAWVDNVVGYLYENGITKGVSTVNKLFGAEDLCSANMYVTFVLRALGYDEAVGDFAYTTAVDDAVSIGVIDAGLADALADKEFLRDDMVMVSFAALTADLKGGEDGTLLDKLIGDGAVDADTAAQYQEQFDAYAALRDEASAPADEAE